MLAPVNLLKVLSVQFVVNLRVRSLVFTEIGKSEEIWATPPTEAWSERGTVSWTEGGDPRERVKLKGIPENSVEKIACMDPGRRSSPACLWNSEG